MGAQASSEAERAGNFSEAFEEMFPRKEAEATDLFGPAESSA